MNNSIAGRGAQPVGNPSFSEDSSVEVFSDRHRHQQPLKFTPTNAQDRSIQPFNLDGLNSIGARQGSILSSLGGGAGSAGAEVSAKSHRIAASSDVDAPGSRLSDASSHTSLQSQELGSSLRDELQTFGHYALKKHLAEPKKPKLE